MSAIWKMTRPAALLAAALVLANPAHAQVRAETPGAAAPAAPTQAQQAGPDALFNRLDKDKNKALSLDEFNAGLQQLQATMALRKLQGNFTAMDANKSGSLEAAEYANLDLVKRAGKSAPQMSAFDADKSQSLAFKEYVAMVQSMVNNQR